MGEYEVFLADAETLAAFTRAYTGRHDPLDALFWLDTPDAPGPSGADSPAEPRQRLTRAAFSREGGLEAERALAAFEAQLEADRAETLAAIAALSYVAPVVTARPSRRGPALIAIGVVAVIAILAGVSLASPIPGDPQPEAAPTRVYPKPSNTFVGTANTAPDWKLPVYQGDASCTNLVDPNTVLTFAESGLRDMTIETARSVNPDDWSLYPFYDFGGFVCVWGSETSDSRYFYAYSPISADLAASQKGILLSRDFTETAENGQPVFRLGAEAYAFGDSDDGEFWVYAGTDIDASLLDQVLAHVPERGGAARTDLQDEVVATSDGVGDLKVGHPVPSSTTIVKHVPEACGTDGQWMGTGEFEAVPSGENIQVVTDPDRYGEITMLRIDTPLIPTKSGIRVGDSLAKLRGTFDDFDAVGDAAAGGIWVLEGSENKIAFELQTVGVDEPPVVVAITILAQATPIPGSYDDIGCST